MDRIEPQEFQEFLAGEAAQGLFVDEGGFRVSYDKALEKLSRFTLPQPGFWILKFVQAAVAAGAKDIRFTFGRRRVTVVFANVLAWKAQDLIKSLLSGQLPTETSQRHLITGILASAAGFSQILQWSCGGSKVTVTRDGPQIEPIAAEADFVFSVTRPPRSLWKHALSSPLAHLVRQTVEEYQALVQRTVACPIPVYLDGYCLRGSYQVKAETLPTRANYDSDNSSGYLFLLAQIPLLGLGRVPLDYPIDEALLEPLKLERDEMRTLRLECSEDKVDGVLCVYSCLQRESRVTLLMDGVELESRILSGGDDLREIQFFWRDEVHDLVFDLYLAVGWNDLDLSQFGVRTQSCQSLMRSQLPVLRDVLQTLRRDCLKPWNLSQKPTVQRDPPGISLGGAAGVAFMGLFIPHMIVLGGLAGGVYLMGKAWSLTGLGSEWYEARVKHVHHQKALKLEAFLDNTIARIETFLEKQDPIPLQ